jgi:hypothetical protein
MVCCAAPSAGGLRIARQIILHSYTPLQAGFASPLGTTVARCAAIPPCPDALAPLVSLRGVAPGASRADVQAALDGSARGSRLLLTREVKSLRLDETRRVWHAELGSDEQAAEAIAALREGMPAALGPDAVAVRWYNETPYAERGWCVLES